MKLLNVTSAAGLRCDRGDFRFPPAPGVGGWCHAATSSGGFGGTRLTLCLGLPGHFAPASSRWRCSAHPGVAAVWPKTPGESLQPAAALPRAW